MEERIYNCFSAQDLITEGLTEGGPRAATVRDQCGLLGAVSADLQGGVALLVISTHSRYPSTAGHCRFNTVAFVGIRAFC